VVPDAFVLFYVDFSFWPTVTSPSGGTSAMVSAFISEDKSSLVSTGIGSPSGLVTSILAGNSESSTSAESTVTPLVLMCGTTGIIQLLFAPVDQLSSHLGKETLVV